MGKRRAREIWEYDSMAEFLADGGVEGYGSGELIIAGVKYVSDSKRIKPIHLQHLDALAAFYDRLLLTNIDNLNWVFGGNGTVTKALSTLHARHNANTLHISCPAESGTNGYGDASFAAPLDLSAYDYIDLVVWADGRDSSSPTWLSFYLFTSAYSATTDHYLASVAVHKPGWNIVRIAKSSFTTNGAANWATIRWIRLRCNSSTNSVRSVYFAEVHAAKARQKRAVISLGFDDGPVSQYHAGTIAASRGISLTFYLIQRLIDTAGYLSSSQVRELAAMGHEIAIHGTDAGYDNWVEHYTAVGHDAFVAAIKKNIQFFAQLGADIEVASWPQGAYANTIEMSLSEHGGPIALALKQAGIKYCRLTQVADVATGRHMAQYNKLYPRNALLLSGGLSLNNANNLAALKAHIDSAIETGSWIAPYGHVLALTAADAVTWSKSDYIELIDYAAAKQHAGLADFRPLGVIARELYANGFLTDIEA